MDLVILWLQTQFPMLREFCTYLFYSVMSAKASVTTCPSLPGTSTVHLCCPNIIINITPFHQQMSQFGW